MGGVWWRSAVLLAQRQWRPMLATTATNDSASDGGGPSLRSRARGERGLLPCDSDVVSQWWHLNYAAIRGNIVMRARGSGGGKRWCWLSGGGGHFPAQTTSRGMGECRHCSCDSDVVLPWRHRNYAAIQGKWDGRAMAPGGGRRLCWLRGGGVPPLRSRAVPIPCDR